MRDIRPDLQERLETVNRELEAMEGKYQGLRAQRDNLTAMLAAESDRWNGVAPTAQSANGAVHSNESAPPSMTALAAILREQLADHKRHHLKDLAQAAVQRGYPFGAKKPGRVVHFALLGMKSGAAIQQMGDGYWRLMES